MDNKEIINGLEQSEGQLHEVGQAYQTKRQENETNHAEQSSSPEFGLPKELEKDETVPQVEDLGESEIGKSLENSDTSAPLEISVVNDQQVIRKRIEGLLNGDEQIPIDGAMNSTYNEILGFSADPHDTVEL